MSNYQYTTGLRMGEPESPTGNARMVPDIQTQKAAFSHVIYRQEESCMSNDVKKFRKHIL
jgi:hypothetical protein